MGVMSLDKLLSGWVRASARRRRIVSSRAVPFSTWLDMAVERRYQRLVERGGK